jgi:CHAT domain-containing protein
LSVAQQLKKLLLYEEGIYACINHDSVQVQLLQRIGSLFFTLSDYSKAINYYQKSIIIINQNAAKPSINSRHLIRSYYWLSVFYDSLQRVTDKMKALDSCAAIAIRLKSINEYCLSALYSRAEYYFNVHDHYRCIDYAKLCESLAIEFANRGSKRDFDVGTQYAISSIVWQVNALLGLKKYNEAENLLENKAEQCREKKLGHNLGVIYGLLAEVLEMKGNFVKALSYHNKAYAIEKQSGESINCKAILNQIGFEIWFKHYKNAEKALAYYNQALNFKVPEDKYRLLNSMESLSIFNRIANVYALQGKYDQALKHMQLAFDQMRPGATEADLLNGSFDEIAKLRKIKHIANLVTDKAVVFHQKYKSAGNLDDLKEAIRIYRIADQFLEKIKTEQLDVKSKLSWRSDRRQLYELAIEACYDYGNMQDAFYFFERSRAVLLYDELKEFHLMSSADMIKQEQLKKSIAFLNKQILQEDRISEHSRSLREELLLIQQELDALNARINTRNPLYSEIFTKTSNISLGEIQQALLKDNDKLIEFFDGDSAVYTILILPNQVFLKRMNKDSLNYFVNEFISYVSDNTRLNKNFDGFVNVSCQLYQMIFQGQALPPGKIIVSPDGQYFPFEALITDKKQPLTYLVRDHPVSYAHSARLLMINFDTKAVPGSGNFLGMAPVNFIAGLNMPSLAGSDISLQEVRSNFKYTKCLNFTSASKNNFIREFPKYKIVQLYTHASDKKNESEPEIYFADSVLFLSELMNERKPATQLIVLSACETGTGKWYRGEGVFSFNRAFAALGVPSSITNLWSVDNVSAYRITELFHKYLAEDLAIDIALQRAKLQFIKESSKEKSLPYYWAATILAGKTNAIDVDQLPVSWKKLTLVIALGVCLLLLAYKHWNKKKRLRGKAIMSFSKGY